MIPRENYLYLPGGRQLPIPVQEEEEDSWRPRERGKQVWVNYPLLYRGDSTGWLWNLEIVGSYVDVQGVGHMVETLRLEEDRAELTRFIVTDDPRRTGTPPGFSTYEADGQITITDVLDYTEVLTIPARLNGKPVAAAYLGGSCFQLVISVIADESPHRTVVAVNIGLYLFALRFFHQHQRLGFKKAMR